MRRLLAWLAGLAGGAAAYRAFRRRPEPAPDHAAELRARLAESRAGADDAEAPPAEEAPSADVEERRRSVHEQARAAIDEMRSD